MKILANDGLHDSAIHYLSEYGFEVLTTKVAQEQVANYINKNQIDILIINQATRIDNGILNATPSLKAIGILSEDFDELDLKNSLPNYITLFKAKHSTTRAQAELVIAHLLTGARNLHQTNREMPLEGDLNFKMLHKHFSYGKEIQEKTLGLIGFNEVAQQVAQLAIGLGMRVIIYDPIINSFDLEICFFDGQKIKFDLQFAEKTTLLETTDFISLHQSAQDDYIISEQDFLKMKKGIGIINIQKGKIIDEVALIDALNDQTVSFAALDAFENQPNPEIQLLMHAQLSLSPNIASGSEFTEEKTAMEIAKEMVNFYKSTIK